jgi:hypothetical protein
MADVDTSLGWLDQLSPNDQVAVLRDPYANLPAGSVEHLKAQGRLDGTTPWIQQNPTGWVIRPPLADVLDDLRERLDQWWQKRCTPEKRDYLSSTAARNSAPVTGR